MAAPEAPKPEGKPRWHRRDLLASTLPRVLIAIADDKLEEQGCRRIVVPGHQLRASPPAQQAAGHQGHSVTLAACTAITRQPRPSSSARRPRRVRFVRALAELDVIATVAYLAVRRVNDVRVRGTLRPMSARSWPGEWSRWGALLAMLWCAGCGQADGANPRLAAIQLWSASGDELGVPLTPAFDPVQTSYVVDVRLSQEDLAISATPVEVGTTITIDGVVTEAGQRSPIRQLVLGANTISVIGTSPDGATATYEVSVRRADTLAQVAYLKASNTGEQDYFGESMALSGDTLVIGAYQEDGNATGVDGDQGNERSMDSGAVYVFTRRGESWIQQAYLKASNTGPTDWFGAFVAVSGDTLAVGAPKEASSSVGVDGDQTDEGALWSGAVYVFTRTGERWAQEAYLKASNAEAGDFFGVHLALSGDTLVVGAPGEDSGATGAGGDQLNNGAEGSGAVYVFERQGAAWSQQAYLKASNTEADDAFGGNVAIAGDTIAVGAHREDSSATGIDGNQADNTAPDSGAVYVFARQGDAWSQEAYVKASNTDAGDWFGERVAMSGATVAVGARWEDGGVGGVDGDQGNVVVPFDAFDSGAAYLFRRADAGWRQDGYFKASIPGYREGFGTSVAVTDDTLLIGASHEGSSAVGVGSDPDDADDAHWSGAAYVYRRQAGRWVHDSYLKASNSEFGDFFGRRVVLSADMMVVAAVMEDSAATGVDGDQANNGGTNSGAVYVFR